jgi:hypothetical protein
LPEHKNILYAPAFRYAWQEVTEALRADIRSKSHNSPTLSILNNTNDYNKALDAGEYEANVDVQEDVITASATFHKQLPFEVALQKSSRPLLFGKTKVAAFGMYYFQLEKATISSILYYEDDDHFPYFVMKVDNAELLKKED